MFWLLTPPAALLTMYLTNKYSYGVLKRRILERQKWDLNICCGRTDGGGVNVDVVMHDDVSNFVEVDDIYNLPFEDGEFGTVLCSHTMEHVDRPHDFFRELQRVGKEVLIVLPPLWDVSAALNILEHKWIFLTFRKEHTALPPRLPLPMARLIHDRIGQRIHA